MIYLSSKQKQCQITLLLIAFGINYIFSSSREKNTFCARLPFQYLGSDHFLNMWLFFFLEPPPQLAQVIQQLPSSRKNMTIVIIIIVICSTLVLIVIVIAVVCFRKWKIRNKKFTNVKRVIVMRPVSVLV